MHLLRSEHSAACVRYLTDIVAACPASLATDLQQVALVDAYIMYYMALAGQCWARGDVDVTPSEFATSTALVQDASVCCSVCARCGGAGLHDGGWLDLVMPCSWPVLRDGMPVLLGRRTPRRVRLSRRSNRPDARALMKRCGCRMILTVERARSSICVLLRLKQNRATAQSQQGRAVIRLRFSGVERLASCSCAPCVPCAL